LYALLHECGHTLQPANNVGINAYKNIDSDEHPKKFVLGRLMNEIDAWDKGLKIAKEMALLHNGFIEFYSENGNTEVRLILNTV
jgi:hypothetical protein